MTETANQILHLYGAGRDTQTKAMRRLDRFGERHFRIGEVVVRPGRRVPVTVGFLAGHLDEVIRHIERGALRLQSDADSFVDPDELRALVNGTPMPVKANPAGPGEDEEAPADDGPGDEIPPEEPSSEPEAPADEPSDQELANEPEQDQGPSLQDEPVEATPDVTPEEMAYMAPLPDAWRTRNKKGLIMLCTERKLEASDKLSNRDLISLLEAWETSHR
jgi:hypothetical protein